MSGPLNDDEVRAEMNKMVGLKHVVVKVFDDAFRWPLSNKRHLKRPGRSRSRQTRNLPLKRCVCVHGHGLVVDSVFDGRRRRRSVAVSRPNSSTKNSTTLTDCTNEGDMAWTWHRKCASHLALHLSFCRTESSVGMPSAKSTQTNKSRLKLLQKREELLKDLFSTAHDELAELQKDAGRYTQLFEGIILQGALAMLESSVTVHARKKDSALVKKAAEGAKEQYKEISGRDVDIDVDASLADSS